MGGKGNIFRFINDVYQEKCPKCKVGEAFESGRSSLSIPKMHDSCSNCNYRFEREPGYFIGAMYLSYALAIAQCVAVYVLLQLLYPSLSIEWILSSLMITILIFSKKNFKWSRLLYIYIFPW